MGAIYWQLNDWNFNRDHREKIYISYDSMNKNCQAGDIEIVEFGHPKTDCGLPLFNYAIAYDTTNREPLFYEKYPGSINDVSQMQMKTYLMQHTNEVVSFGPAFSKYFILHYNEKNEVFQFHEDRTDVIECENELSGYFCIITSEEMNAKEALHLYKSRDISEKLFRGDKSYLEEKVTEFVGILQVNQRFSLNL